jgi:hypothetical protein
MGGNYPFEQGPQARAITWDEARRMGGGGGGGPGGPDREPSWLGKKFREIACGLIDRELGSLDKQAQSPKEWVENRDKTRDLTDEFNRFKEEPGVGVTFEAIRTITRYKAPLLFKLAFAEPSQA